MAFTHSLSAITLKLEIFEAEALIDWHRDNQRRYADREEYREAADSKQRVDELELRLHDHRAALSKTIGIRK